MVLSVRRWHAIWMLLAVPSVLGAQSPFQAITGIVRDTAGAPLGGAEVLLGQHRATTSPSGAFRVDSLRPGQYAITIRLVGYRPVHSKVVVVASEPTEMEYFMVAAPYLLAPIVVESRRTGIYGAVGDTGYKAAVGARVQVVGPMGGEALTDSMGRFAFPEADHGLYMVRVTYPGYSERRFSVELKRGEGRELGVLLTRATEIRSAVEEGALDDLGHRLAGSLARERMTTKDLERHGSGGLCDIAQIRSEVGRGSGATTTLILNGATVYWEFDVGSLCSWRADEVELVEFGEDACKDVTQTIVGILNASGPPLGKQIVCSGRARKAPRSFVGGGVGVMHSTGGSYVIIWEKR
jgi:hypothetical protein